MSDVATNAHASITGINNGSSILFAQKTGGYEQLLPWASGVGVNNFLTSGEMFAKWDDRFDDVTYYAGSGA